MNLSYMMDSLALAKLIYQKALTAQTVWRNLTTSTDAHIVLTLCVVTVGTLTSAVMDNYPSAKRLKYEMREYPVSPFKLTRLNEFLAGKDDYPKVAYQLGVASEEFERLANFMAYMLTINYGDIDIYFGTEAYGTFYSKRDRQIHINIENLDAALHEIGHVIWGPSELEASAFSATLIMATDKYKGQEPILDGHKLTNHLYL